MASLSGWFDGEGIELLQQDVVAALIPLAGDEHAIEIQMTLRPGSKAKSVELGKTNFGFLAVRVAKTLSVHFGGGTLTNSEKQIGEPAIFGKRARWVDYSGPVAAGNGRSRRTVIEGITFHDHPNNERYPSHWHVREDGWMGASFCLQDGFTIQSNAPLTLRYLLHAHRGAYDHAKAQTVHKAFAERLGFQILKATRKHRQYEIERFER
jgi:hypothetical protein